MRKILIIFVSVFLLNCSHSEKNKTILNIQHSIASGDFSIAIQQIDKLIEEYSVTEDEKLDFQFTKDSLHRVMLDFNKTETDIIEWIEKNHGFTPSNDQLEIWQKNKSLEYKVIDGEKRYFRNAAPNLFRVNPEATKLSLFSKPKSDLPKDALLIDALLEKTKSETENMYWLPQKKMKAKYTLTINPDKLAENELVRVWLPFPRKDIERQSDVKLLTASHDNYILSDDKTVHTSIYMEQTVKSGEPLFFSVEYLFSSQGQWFDLSKINWNPYDYNSEFYKTYTAEKPPHIVFSKTLKEITDSVTAGKITPIEILNNCYRYITANYPWASALEYSTIPNIPEYAIEYRKGDCGQVALLLITMLRYKGIPARWQSGWMVHPGEVNLHDWLEVYIEKSGWIPVDISFGRGNELNHPIGREFFMSGIDSYRLYINSDFSGTFYPEKKLPRSETVDFQRGEVEIGSRNLYFDEWSYNMEIEYLN